LTGGRQSGAGLEKMIEANHEERDWWSCFGLDPKTKKARTVMRITVNNDLGHQKLIKDDIAFDRKFAAQELARQKALMQKREREELGPSKIYPGPGASLEEEERLERHIAAVNAAYPVPSIDNNLQSLLPNPAKTLR